VILPAAGLGQRFAASGPAGEAATSKIEQDLGGQPVFLRAIEAFVKVPEVGQILLAVNPRTISEFKFRWGDRLGFHGVKVVAGGTRERWETVKLALDAVADGITHVAVHDAARPLVSRTLVDRVFDAAERFAAVIPALPVSNTLKRVAEDQQAQEANEDPLDRILGEAGSTRAEVKRVVETVARADLVEVQTPQVFQIDLLKRAYASVGELPGVTDDASLVEALGEPVHVVPGESTNFKITRPGDLELARMIVQKFKQKEAAISAKRRLFADED
jgi:2-C-methyl-D-erythritol 4-phosphate cytidylyltransferase